MVIQLRKNPLIHHRDEQITIKELSLIVTEALNNFRNTQQGLAYMQILYECSIREVDDRHGHFVTHLAQRIAGQKARFIVKPPLKSKFSRKSSCGSRFTSLDKLRSTGPRPVGIFKGICGLEKSTSRNQLKSRKFCFMPQLPSPHFQLLIWLLFIFATSCYPLKHHLKSKSQCGLTVSLTAVSFR